MDRTKEVLTKLLSASKKLEESYKQLVILATHQNTSETVKKISNFLDSLNTIDSLLRHVDHVHKNELENIQKQIIIMKVGLKDTHSNIDKKIQNTLNKIKETLLKLKTIEEIDLSEIA